MWVFGGNASYRGVVPDNPFDPKSGHWGAFEIAARVAGLEVDNETFPVFANPASAARSTDQWTLGLNWHFNRNFKLVLNYENLEFEGGALDGNRPDEEVFLARAQIAF